MLGRALDVGSRAYDGGPYALHKGCAHMMPVTGPRALSLFITIRQHARRWASGRWACSGGPRACQAIKSSPLLPLVLVSSRPPRPPPAQLAVLALAGLLLPP